MAALMLMLAAAAPVCGDQPSQTAMTMCQKAEADRADAEMNQVWKQVRSAMQAADRQAEADAGASHVEALVGSQRAWLTFRDAQCKIASYEWLGGTMQPFTYNQCLAEVTRSRTGQLRMLLSWAGER